MNVLEWPVAENSAITAQEGTPYIFQWSDFHFGDGDTPNADLKLWMGGHPEGGTVEFWNGTSWVGVPMWQPISKADVDAQRLRFYACMTTMPPHIPVT